MLFLLIGLTVITIILLTILLLRKPPQNNSAIELQERMKMLHEQTASLQTHLTEHLMRSFDLLRGQIVETLKQNTEQVDKQIHKLTEQTDLRLREINGQVEKRLAEGFEKTNATFHDVVKRLALIDEAQKKITELSTNVVSLQEILVDKRSRGAFGEVQLSSLVSNVLPENCYALQYTFPNGVRADCVLFLPTPTGNICIDSKFPLENYQKMLDRDITEAEKMVAVRQFKQDIKKHIHDVAEKYIIPNETSDGVILFIPAEAIFAEIHSHYPELVQEAHQARVWMASPTTLMAILTTARAAIKDDATRKQINIIQQHLNALNKDFSRFSDRMNKLATHIRQANEDVGDINTSAQKITARFAKIEQVELEHAPLALLDKNE
jgi:DNA recombination protein RmuC